MASLQLLAKKQELLAKGNEKLGQLRAVISSVEERIASEGADAEADELADQFGLDTTAPTEADLSPVEEYAQQKQLQALWEDIGQ